MIKFSSPQSEIAFLNRVVALQARELNEQSARLRSAWIERERLKNILRSHGLCPGTSVPDLVPLMQAAQQEIANADD